MGVGGNAGCDLSMQGSHPSSGFHTSHFHAHLPTLEFDENSFRIQGLLEVGSELFTKAFLQLWLT